MIDICTVCCNGRVSLTGKAGRTSISPTGQVVSIPADVLLPTCDACGAEFVDEGAAAALDALHQEATAPLPPPDKAFCDFCRCGDCQKGTKYLHHAETSDGRWICDCCWLYDMCTMDHNPFGVPRSRSGPCDERDCPHRPKLVGEWLPWSPA